MDDARFTMLFHVLKFLQQEDLRKAGLDKAIARLIESFDAELAPEQRALIVKAFAQYERSRREQHSQENQRKEAIIEEEKYREAINKFLREEDTRFGF